MPELNVRGLQKLGAASGLLLDLKALDGPLEVTVALRCEYRPDGGALSLAWQHAPEIGDPITERMNVELATRPEPLGCTYVAACPHCGVRYYRLVYAVTTWACRDCLGMRTDTVRLKRRYTVEKQAKLARAAMGLTPIPLSPIVVKSRARRHIELADRLWHLEAELMRRLGGRE